MKNDSIFLLKVVIAICLCFAGLRLVKFAFSRVPVYKEGTCLADIAGDSLLQFEIKKNHILEGYSDIVARSIYFEKEIQVGFDAQREEDDLVRVECQK